MKPPYLDWGGTQVEPTPAQKSAGFTTGDRPPAQWWNWQLGTIDAWIKYFETQYVSVVEANALLQQPREFALPDQMLALDRNGRALCMVGYDACYSSFDNGITWAKDNNIYAPGKVFLDILTTGNQQFVAVGLNGHVQRANTSTSDQIWNAPVVSTFGTSAVNHIASDGGGALVIAGEDGKNAHSLDAGNTWIANTPLPWNLMQLVGNPNAPGFMGSAYYDGTGAGVTDTIWKSTDGTAFTAVDLTSALSVNEWPGSVAYSSRLGGWLVTVEASTGFAGLLLSTDNGTTWTRLSTEIDTFVRGTLLAPNGLLLLGTGIFGYSTFGTDWHYVLANVPELKMFTTYQARYPSPVQGYAARNLGTGYSLTTWAY